MLAVLLALCGALALPKAAVSQTAGICDRTLEVQDEIIRSVPGVVHCSKVTSTHLEGITTLGLSHRGGDGRQVSSLKSGDFAGLSNLQSLDLSDNKELTSLPANLFQGLSNLQFLWLTSIGLTSLPANLFQGLSNLQFLWLTSIGLTSLPANLFQGLSNLRSLSLNSISLTSLSANLFQGLSSLDALYLGWNRLTSLPANLFKGLSSLLFVETSYSFVDLYLDLALERVGSGRLTEGSPITLRANILQGAPGDISVTWKATALNGLVNGAEFATGTVTIGSGDTASGSFTVTGTRGTDGKAPNILVRITSPEYRDEPFADVTGTSPQQLYFSASGVMRLDFSAGSALSRAVVRITEAKAEEGKIIKFPVRLSQTASSDVTLNWEIKHSMGSKAAGSGDIDSTGSGSLTITAGNLSRKIRVQTIDDLTPEEHETFTVFLSAPDSGLPDGVVIGTAKATGTIENDDTRISIANTTMQESDKVDFKPTLSHPVKLDGKRNCILSCLILRMVVSHITTNDDDFEGLEISGTERYTKLSPELVDPKTKEVSGKLVTKLTARLDETSEGDETFRATLHPPLGGFPAGRGITFINGGTAIGTIKDPVPAAISIGDAEADEGEVLRFPVTISKALHLRAQLSWTATDDTALVSDYLTRSSGTIIIPSGQTSATIEVHTRQDRLSEPVETFIVTLSWYYGRPDEPAVIADDTATGTVHNEDAAIAIGDAAAREGDAITFTVRLDQPVSKDVTLRWVTADDPGATAATPQAQGTGATAGTDYTVQSAGSLTIAAGQSLGTIAVQTTDDDDDEADETFRVILSEPTGSGLTLTLADAEALGTIRNDDAASISIADTRTQEGESLTFTVSLGEPWTSDVAVNWSLRDDTAATPADYPANQSGSFVIKVGAVTGMFTVTTTEDRVAEGDETLKAVITVPDARPWPHRLRVTDAEALGTIVDDDTATVSIGDSAANEGGVVAFEVSLNRAADEDVTLSWRTHDGSAQAPGDYTAESAGSVTVPAGQKRVALEVQTAADTVPEGTETFRVVLSAPSTGLPPRVALGDTEATGAIWNATPVPVPAQPVVTATAGDKEVALGWSDPSDSTITGWQVRYKVKTASTDGIWTEILNSDHETDTHTVTSLTNGIEYTFQVRAVNGSGDGLASVAKDATPVGRPGAPEAPALTAGDGQLGVSWTAPADTGGSAITDYDVQYRSGTSGVWIDHAHTGTALTATLTGLTNGQSYQVRVRAENAQGESPSWSPPASATPVPVPAQPVVTATAGDKEVALGWSDPSDSTITGWQVRYKVKTASTDGIWTEILNSDHETDTHTVTSLTNGIEYTFQVRAVNGSGDGLASVAKDATPVGRPGAPEAPALTAGDGQLGVSWTAPADTGGSAITDYDVQYRSGTSGVWIDHAHTGTALTATLTGLTNGQSYQVRVRAENAQGESPSWSPPASATPVPVPAQPVVTATAGDKEVALGWSDPSDSTITGWQVRYKVKTASTDGIWTEILNSDHETDTHTVTSLTNGIEYTFQVRAVNGSGDGLASVAKDATPVGRPGAPEAPALTAGDGQLGVSWTAPADTGGSAITDYDVQYRSGTSGVWIDHAHTGTALTATLTGLTNGQSYQVRVRAENAQGESPSWSPPASATPVPVPAQPVVTATAGDKEVALGWSDPSDSTITGWQVRYKVKTASTDGIWTEILNSDHETDTHTVTSLTNGIEYTFQVRAVNGSGDGLASVAKDATPVGRPGAPEAPALTAGDGQLGVSWTAPADTGGSAITDYDVQYRSGTSGVWIDHAHTGTALTATLTGLTNGQSYQVRVRAENAQGESPSWSPPASATPVPVPAQPVVTATAGDKEVALGWSDPSDSTITGWQVRYKVKTASTDGIWTEILNSDHETDTHTVTSLTNGIEYTFQVRAVNGSGDGLASVAKDATPVGRPGAPEAPALTAGDGQLGVSWTAPADTGGSAITDYDVQYRSGTSGVWIDHAHTGTALTATLTGLTNGQSYQVRVRAENAQGESPSWSPPASATPVPVPAQPVVTATAGDKEVALGWSDPSDSTITGWQVRYKVKTASTDGIWTEILNSDHETDTHTVTSLTNGIEYTFQVRAVNGSGDGLASVAKDATPVGRPGAPEAPALTAGDGQLGVSWTAPADTGGSAITDYDVQYRSGTSGVWIDHAHTGTALTATLTGLTNGQSYQVRVRAENAQGESPSWSPPASATPVPVPAQPVVTATAGDKEVALGWSDPSDSTITGWQVRYKVKTASTDGIWTEILNSDHETDTHTVTSLTNGIEYTFQVRAVNGSGDGLASVAKDATPVGRPGAPEAPALTAGDGQLGVSWTAPADTGGSAITDYDVQYRSGTSGVWIDHAHTGTALTATLTGLTNGQSYQVRVRAENAQGESPSWSPPASATPVPVPAQPVVTATAGDKEVALGWSDPSDSTITGWQVRYKVKTASTDGIWTEILNSDHETDTHTVTSLTNGIEYTFQVRAVNGSGDGLASVAKDATPVGRPGAPEAPALTAGDGQLGVSWTAPADTGGSAITDYDVQYRSGTSGVWIDHAHTGTALTATLTGLTNGQSYQVRVRAENAQGESPSWSPPASATPVPVPAQPVVTATAGDKEVALGWSDPSDSTITGWQVRYKVKTASTDGIWTEILNSDHETDTHTVTSLTNGIEYTFQVRAVNGSGDGLASVAKDATPVGRPGAPEAPALTAGDGQLGVSWTAPADTGGSAITDYDVQYRSGTSGVWIDHAHTGTALTATLTGLTNGQSYQVRVRAENAQGESPSWSPPASATPVPVPAQPVVTATAGDKEVALGWSDPSDSTITGWQVRYKVKTASTDGIWTEILNSDHETDTHTVTSLTNGIEYTFQVRAVNGSGDGLASVAKDATPVGRPGAPEAPALTAGDGQLGVSWTAPADTGGSAITDYDVQYRSGTSGVWIDHAHTGTALTATLTGLTNGQSYQVRVRAENAQGESPSWSPPASATPVPVPAQPVVTATAGDKEVALGWSDPSDSTITGWQVRYKVKTASTDGIWTEILNSDHETDTHTVTSLTNGIEYTFQVRAVNGSGDGLASVAKDATPVGRPGAPEAPALTAGDGQLGVSWTAPADTGGSAITDYDVQYRSGTSGVWIDHAHTGTALTATLTGLTNGQSYQVRVRAENAQGESPSWSPPASATPVPVPAQPVVTATAGDKEVALGWSDPSDSTITGWQVRYKVKTASTDGIWTEILNSDHETDTHTVTSLTNGIEYTFQVRAVNGSGDGLASVAKDATPVGRPGAPEAPALTAGDGQLGVSWTAPADTGGSAITDYDVQYRSGTSGVWIDHAHTGTALTATLTGLTNGQSYQVRVRAENAQGESPSWSPPASATPVPVPAQPVVTATAGDKEVALGWSDPSDSTITGWQVRYKVKTASTDGIWTEILNSDHETDTHTVTSLTNGIEYTFQVRAVNGSGDGLASVAKDATPVGRPGAPEAPALTAGDGQLGVSWTAPADTGGSAITDYDVQYRSGTSGVWIDHAHTGTALTATLTGLTNGQSYQVRVRAENAQGESPSWSPPASATPVPVPAQPVVTATAGDKEVALGWSDPSDSTITGWQVRYKVKTASTDGIWTEILNSDHETDTHTVTSLTNGIEYTFQVRAVNGSGDGLASVAKDATPVGRPGAPEAPALTAGDGQLGVSWTAPADTGGSAITDYDVQYRSGTSGVWIDHAHTGTALTATLTGLTNGQSYQVRVRAENAQGESPSWSPPASATPVPVPAQPVVTATAGDKEVALGWSDPSDSTITGWQVRYKVKTASTDGIWTEILNSDHETDTHTVTSLTNGIEYTFQVRAVNGSGDGLASVAKDATPVGRPGAPEAPALTAGDGQLGVSWTAPADTGGSAITDYDVQYRSGTSGVWIDHAHTGTALTATLTGLTNGQSYQVRVRAENAQGESPSWSPPASATPVPVPAQPVVTATAGDKEVALGWSDPSDSTITGWQVRYKVKTASTDGIWTEILNSDHETDTHTVTSLTNGIEYTFQVRAVNGSGDGLASVAKDATPVGRPGAPEAPALTAGDGQLGVSWTAPADTGGSAITDYDVQYRSGTSGVWIDHAHTGTALTATLTGLTNGQSYQVRVRAENAQGESPSWSPPASATPVPVPAQPVVTATAGDKEVALGWSDPSDSTITGWQVRYKVKTASTDGIWTEILNSDHETDTHTVTSLTNGIEYTFQVRAVNGSGDGLASVAKDATPVGRPGAPEAPALTAGDGQLGVSWTAPADTGGSAITDYDVQYRSGTSGVWIDHAHTGTALTATLTGLTNGQSYQVRVRAENAQGESPSWSPPASATPVPVPAQPVVTATAGDKEVALGWSDPSDSTITGWQVRYKVKTASTDGIWTEILNSDHETDTHTVTSLTNGIEYTFQVRAVNGSGDGLASVAKDATPVGRPGAPEAPAKIVLTATDAKGDVMTEIPEGGGETTVTVTAWVEGGSTFPEALVVKTRVEGSGTVGVVRFTTSPGTFEIEIPANRVSASRTFVLAPEDDDENEDDEVVEISGEVVPQARRVRQTAAPQIPVVSAMLVLTDDDNLAVTGPRDVEVNEGETQVGRYAVNGVTDTAITWSLTGGDARSFGIDGDGILTFHTAPDFEAPSDTRQDNVYRVTVAAVVNGGRSVTAAVTVTVVNANESPAFEQDRYAFELEENRIGPVELGKLTATDPDADDTLVYALSGDGKELFEMDTTSGVLSYIGPGEDYESDPNVYDLTVSATDDGGLSATAAVIVEILDVNEAPVFEQERYEFELEENRIGPVELGELTAADPDAGEPVVYALSGDGVDRFAIDTTSGVLTYTGPGEDYETKPNVYELTVSATDDEGLSAGAGVTVTVTDEADATARARLRRVNQAILPELSRTMVSGAVEEVARRIKEAGPPPAPGNGYSVAGHSGIGEALIANEEALNEGTMDWKRALAGSSFALRLGGGETLMGSLPGQATIWGEGDWRELEVGGETGPVKFEGDVRGARLGLDTRLRDDLLAGVALSWTQGSFDYTDRGGAGYRPTAGRHESRMTSVYPYVGWWPRPDVGLWGTVGYGEGEVEIDDEEAGAQSSDSALRAAALGGQVRLFSDDDLIQGGTTALTLKGEAWAGRFDLKDDGGRMRGMEVDVRRLRLGLEGEHARRLVDGSTLTPSLELGLRHDDGDGEVGRGVELGGGLTWSDPVRGLTAGIHGRTLLAHHGDLEEWGVGGQVTFGPGVDGHGLSFSLEPSWGEAQSGLARLWEDGAAANDPLAGDVGTAMRLDAEIGYGLPAFGGHGVLTPYGGLALSDGGSRTWRAGGRLAVGPALHLSLEVERRESAGDAPDHSLMLRVTARW